MKTSPHWNVWNTLVLMIVMFLGFVVATPTWAQAPPTSYIPVIESETFDARVKAKTAEKAAYAKRHNDLLAERYDLSDNPAPNVKMTRGKPIQQGVRVKLPQGITWEQLADMKPAEIKAKGIWPNGFLPLPHPKQEEGGMVFPKFHIDEIKKQEIDRDLTRFDMEFDLPDHILPEFPPAIFLTTRPDLGDVSQGQVVTIKNYYELFNGILNPKQIEGLRLLLLPTPQQQFNMTADRMTLEPHRGVTCFDCHVNGHSNGTTHLVGDIRPTERRHRLDTPPLRGAFVQRLFGSQRALKTVEDFTEFEQRAAYFDGDPVTATKKGVNILERGSQVHFMAEFISILDFPPAPKLDLFGKLDPSLATESELRGEVVFHGKGRCAECHPTPYYTDNLMHDFMADRFFAEKMYNGRLATGDGKIKTFPLRGIKESAPYLHDGRLLTLEDTVEYHNLIFGTKLTAAEKKDTVDFLRCL